MENKIDYKEVEKAAKVMAQFWARMAISNPVRSAEYNKLRLEARNVWVALAAE
jgi:hypothetical protein